MRIKLFLSLMTLGLILISCDDYNYVHYTVYNKTGDSIKFSYSFDESYSDNQKTDTSIILKEYQKDTLFIFLFISSGVWDPEDCEKMIYISNMDIMRLNDSSKILKDVSLRRNWKYTETGRYSANMELVIRNIDF
jgi:hypothetical protein